MNLRNGILQYLNLTGNIQIDKSLKGSKNDEYVKLALLITLGIIKRVGFQQLNKIQKKGSNEKLAHFSPMSFNFILTELVHFKVISHALRKSIVSL